MAQQEQEATKSLRLSALSLEVVGDIAGIYDNVVGGHAVAGLDMYREGVAARKIRQVIVGGHESESRYGSVLSGDSKLVFRPTRPDPDQEVMVEVHFRPNVDENDMEKARILQTTFNIMVGAYLQVLREQGIKVDL